MKATQEDREHKEHKEYIATITSKGQVTIPIEVRNQLHLSPQDKIIFRVVEGNRLEIEPLPMTLEEAYGSVPPLNQPEDFAVMKRIIDEDRAERWHKKQKR